jgi:hypothetical protein
MVEKIKENKKFKNFNNYLIRKSNYYKKHKYKKKY